MRAMAEHVYIVKGIRRHFSGDVRIEVVCACRDEVKAKEKGALWVKNEQEKYACEQSKWHASYEIVWRELL